MAKKSKTHFLIFYVKESGSYVITTPRLWAHEHPTHFESDNPRDREIEKYLTEIFGFIEIPPNDKTKVLHHFDLNIRKGKNGSSFYK